MSEEERKQHLAVMVADVIQDLLRNSEELSNILNHAHAEGYNVLLSIVSGVVVRRRETASPDAAPVSSEEPLPLSLEFNEADKAFLHSIGIRATD